MDLRIKRTRLFIINAFFDLIKEKGFDALTIGDLSERAMINRSTFYHHYKDKYDLAEKCLEERFNVLIRKMDRVQQEISTERQAFLNILNLLTHIEENADLYQLLFGRNGISIFISQLHSYIIRLLRFRFQNIPEINTQSVIPQSMFEEFLAGAYIGTIQWWLEHISEYSVEEVSRWLYTLVAKGSETALGLER